MRKQEMGTRSKSSNQKITLSCGLLILLFFWVFVTFFSYFLGADRRLRWVLPASSKIVKPTVSSFLSSPTSLPRSSSTQLPSYSQVPDISSEIFIEEPHDHIANFPTHDPMLSLLRHPLHQISFQNLSIDELLFQLHQRKECRALPIFITMAKIASPIYAQLVENFYYTMLRYNLLDCSLLICLNDPNCLRFCQSSSFPCYNYVEANQEFSTFEQIAQLKLFDIPKASLRGVPLFIVDIDVGFRLDPRLLIGNFLSNKSVDVLVQKDVTFIMNRTLAGWKTWYTRDLPNLGLFLCKGNQHVSEVFAKAWHVYQAHSRRRNQPGTDQAIVQSALGRRGKNAVVSWDFFPDDQAVLLDKIYKFESTAVELGGTITANLLSYYPLTSLKRQVVAAHATCYELRTKVDALKAVAAFWNPYYYLPERPTLTMGLYYLNAKQLLNDLRGLVWLAASTNRSLLIPNVPHVDKKTRSTVTFLNATSSGTLLWPGFRVAYRFPTFPVDVVEPGYYWRIENDYHHSVPQPRVLSAPFTSFASLRSLLLQHQSEPRVVLNIVPKAFPALALKTLEDRLVRWALTSGEEELQVGYPTHGIFEKDTKTLTNIRLCHQIFHKPRGNRSCFDKCK